MELTPEERRKIYEEEKNRIEEENHTARQEQPPVYNTTINMEPGVAGLLCYVGWWITGLIFFIIEQKNQTVRFHAAQSLVFFGCVCVFAGLINLIPYVGPVLSGISWFIGFVMWIVLMVKAYQGERFKLALFGDLAERMVVSAGATAAGSPAPAVQEEQSEPRQDTPRREVRQESIDQKIERAIRERTQRQHSGHIAGSAAAIVFSIVFLVFFNFFHEWVAYYDADTAGASITWARYSFFTSEINLWLPLLTTTLALSIAGHFIIIIFYRPLLRRIITFVLDTLGLATVISLVVIFPFDFSVIPNTQAATITTISVTAALICISVGIGISLIVRLVQVLVALGTSVARAD